MGCTKVTTVNFELSQHDFCVKVWVSVKEFAPEDFHLLLSGIFGKPSCPGDSSSPRCCHRPVMNRPFTHSLACIPVCWQPKLGPLPLGQKNLPLRKSGVSCLYPFVWWVGRFVLKSGSEWLKKWQPGPIPLPIHSFTKPTSAGPFWRQCRIFFWVVSVWIWGVGFSQFLHHNTEYSKNTQTVCSVRVVGYNP